MDATKMVDKIVVKYLVAANKKELLWSLSPAYKNLICQFKSASSATMPN